jgi:phosphatidylserine/phosphatidylglycerophosphate/cardiolipin synthase-like enzyme
VRFAATLLYGHLLREGVEVHEYCARPLHGKIAIVDDAWSTVGSSNLDPLSLALNNASASTPSPRRCGVAAVARQLHRFSSLAMGLAHRNVATAKSAAIQDRKKCGQRLTSIQARTYGKY